MAFLKLLLVLVDEVVVVAGVTGFTTVVVVFVVEGLVIYVGVVGVLT